MNNLKRIFSLALATVMVIGMMVVGASATSFPDDAEIENKAAVETMNALGIIGGREDGSFDPTATVTRAEMAKMITFALNGGKDINYGLKNNNSFTDVKPTDWFAEYVEYCASLGIVGGRGDGSFDPYAKVTGQEAAKMMLVALGYDATIFGFGGANWATNVDYYASNLTQGDEIPDANDPTKGSGKWNNTSLYNSVAGLRTMPLTRDDAAQLIYNGLNANTVTSTVTGIQNGAPVYTYNLHSPSLLENKFGAEVKYGILKQVTYNAATSTTAASWSYVIDNDTTTYVKLPIDASELFMQRVRIITRKDARNNVTVLAITAASTVIDTGVVEDLLWKDGKLNGYTVDSDTIANVEVYEGFNETAVSSKNPSTYRDDDNCLYTYKLIDNTDDGNIDCMVVVPFNMKAVKNVSAAGVTTSDGVIYRYEDKHEIYADPAEGDIVIVTDKANGTAKLEKATLVNGTVGAVRDTQTNSNQIRVNGTWYTVPSDTTYGDGLDEVSNTEYNFVLVGGYVFAAVPVNGQTSTGVKDLALVLDVDDDLVKGDHFDSASEKYQRVQLLFTDGTKAIVNVNKLQKANATEADKVDDGNKLAASDKGSIVSFTEKDGFYTLNAKKNEPEMTDYTDGATKVELKNGLMEVTVGGNASNVRLNNDAVLFVRASWTANQTAKTDYKVLTGAEISAWKNNAAIQATSKLYGIFSNTGFKYASYGVLDLNTAIPGAAGTKSYGWIVEDAYTTMEGTKTFWNVTIWNGTENVEVKQENVSGSTVTSVNELKAGIPVSFDDLGNNQVKNLTKLTDTARVTAFDGTTIVVGAGEKAFEKFTVIFVDTKTNKGYTTGTIKLATNVDNVYTDGASYLFVDVNNKIHGATPDPTCDHAALVGQTTENHTAANAATCTQPGNPEYWQCPVCHKYLTGATAAGSDTAPVIDATGHHAIDNPSTSADYVPGTEGNAGKHAVKCKDCNEAVEPYVDCTPDNTGWTDNTTEGTHDTTCTLCGGKVSHDAGTSTDDCTVCNP